MIARTLPLAALMALLPVPARSCTRVVYLGPGGTVVTARSVDWTEDTRTNLWLLPRGQARDGAAGARSLRWVSRYGSLVATCFDGCTVDGMNERGLVASMLYLAETEYPRPEPDDPRRPICASTWAQYCLDQYASVDEAAAALDQAPFFPVSSYAPDGRPLSMHLALSDPSGDSAILEYLGGRLVIHHGHQFQVLTNSPDYDRQLALKAYWNQVGGAVMLPGTGRPADRFVRASYYLRTAPSGGGGTQAVACAFAVIRNASVPLGQEPGGPSPTLWRSVADQKNRRYYFESTFSPSVFWVDLAELDFRAGAPVRELELGPAPAFAGAAAARFKPAAPFTFLTVPWCEAKP